MVHAHTWTKAHFVLKSFVVIFVCLVVFRCSIPTQNSSTRTEQNSGTKSIMRECLAPRIAMLCPLRIQLTILMQHTGFVLLKPFRPSIKVQVRLSTFLTEIVVRSC